jgi:DNA-directed RNA polymerase specialized sigma24 family protein
MSDTDYAWLRYADLQQRSRNTHYSNDYSWGIEAALDYLVEVTATGNVPSASVLDAAINRAISSGARLRRSRSAALKKWLRPAESLSTSAAAEATVMLAKIRSIVSRADHRILLATAFGYTDREIAGRHASTPGAVRARIFRLRNRLADTAAHLSTGEQQAAKQAA